jgi:3-oxoacyl-[acyl-carrier-protein] synthase II
MGRRVVITGLGTINAAGNDVPTAWSRILSGRSAVRRVTRFDAGGYASQIAGEVRDFDPVTAIGARPMRRMGRFAQLGFVAGLEAMADAGFERDVGPWPEPERFGVFVGSGIGGIGEIVEESEIVRRRGVRRVSAFFIPQALNNLAAGHLAITLGAEGPGACPATACAASNHAIGMAFKTIRDDEADVALAGGAEAALTPLTFGGFMSMKALSGRNADPERASRPFDRDRDGFVIGEGAGIVLLESEEHARRRGARIYCEVVGVGSSTDGWHVTAPHPKGTGAVRAMRAALRSAGVQPHDVDYVSAHGTSTPQNDPVETRAIREVFGAHADQLAVSSIKGVVGHALGAAAGIEAVTTALALHSGWVPPTANLENPDPACDLDYVPLTARQLFPHVALSNAFGFGGTNYCLVFRRWEST